MLQKTDLKIIENLASRVLNQKSPQFDNGYLIIQATLLFLDELCTYLNEYIDYYNELVFMQNKELLLKVFRFSNAKPGIMVLKAKDKILIYSENNKIKLKVVQINGYSEKQLLLLEFEAKIYKHSFIEWTDNDNNYVSPQSLIRYLLSPFFIYGSKAFDKQIKSSVLNTYSEGNNEQGSNFFSRRL